MFEIKIALNFQLFDIYLINKLGNVINRVYKIYKDDLNYI